MSLQAEINRLQEQNIKLHAENEELKKEQKEFQDALVAKIEAFQKLGPWKRFWSYIALITDIITTIEEAVAKAKNK